MMIFGLPVIELFLFRVCGYTDCVSHNRWQSWIKTKTEQSRDFIQALIEFAIF